MIRRGRLRQSGKRAPATLKQREGRDGAVGDSPPIRVGDLRIFAAELNFDDLGAGCCLGVGSGCRRFGEKGDAEGVAAGPGDGDARNWKGEAMVERVNCDGVTALAGEWDQDAIADCVGGHFFKIGDDCVFRVLGGLRLQMNKCESATQLN